MLSRRSWQVTGVSALSLHVQPGLTSCDIFLPLTFYDEVAFGITLRPRNQRNSAFWWASQGASRDVPFTHPRGGRSEVDA